MRQWRIGLDSWIIQDGNYPDLAAGQIAEFALEFYFREAAVVTEPTQPNLEPVQDAEYLVRGEVVTLLDRVWVLNCGLVSIYQDSTPPSGVAVGDMVFGRATLGIDPFSYFERLHSLVEMPPLIYTWRIDEVRMQTAPFIKAGRGLERDPTKVGWREVEQTDAWHDDEGRATYLLVCTLLEVPPKRSSATAVQ